MPSAHNRSIAPSSFFHCQHHPTRSLASSPSPASSAPTSPAHVNSRRRESKDAASHPRENQHTHYSSSSSSTTTTTTHPHPPPHMSAPKTSAVPHFDPQRSRASARRIGIRRKDDVRPERKASVRKQVYDLGDDEDDEDDDLDLDDDDDDDQDDYDLHGILDDSDLSDVPPADDGNSSIHLDSDSDSDMAAKLQAAGDGESLLGSGESGDEQEDDEERFIIADATMADSKAAAQKARSAEQARRRAHAHSLRNKQRRRREEQGTEGDIEDAADAGPEDDLGSLSPDTMRLLGLPVLEDELFQEQEGFHSDSEPSFSDFFGSDGGGDQHDDDDELTSFDTSDEDDDISDLDDAALVGEPLIAHVGAPAADASSTQQQNATSAQDLQLAMEAGAEIARQDIPLLVIEDLDGRLIYARAGDGEAVFGSDGEFEFVESDEDEDNDDEFFSGGIQARQPHTWANTWPSQEEGDGGIGIGGSDVFDDEGDTTDELPDEDMPFPRLLVGSVDPRGGRTSRRARAMAAQMRRLSPNVASGKRGHMRTESAQTDDAMSSITSPRTPTADVDAPLPSTPAPAQQQQQQQGQEQKAAGDADAQVSSMGPPQAVPSSSAQGDQQAVASTSAAGPSTISFGVQAGDANVANNAMSQLSQLPQGIVNSALPATPAPKDRTMAMGGWPQDGEGPRPEMGSFMPSSSKSVHRAVIDGSRQAASPFTSKYSLQRRGLAGRRRPRRSSFSSSQGAKRARRGSLPSVFTGEDLSEAASSPEALKTAAPLPMELDDVVDASMLWRSDTSSESEGQDSDASGGTAVPRRRSRSKTTQSSTDGFGLNSNAFSRWRKIPMGAFRDQQQGVLQGGGAAAAAAASSSRRPGTGGSGAGGQQGFGNYLLTRVSHPSQRRIEHSPFRRTGSHHVGSLHMMVPSAHTPHASGSGSGSSGGAGRRASLIVSPVLWPVHGRNRGGMGGIEDHETASAQASPLPQRGNESAAGSRKMTKREKRERKAQRAAMRAAARAEKERLRAEATGEMEQVGGDAGSAAATAPTTPNVGPLPARSPLPPAAADVLSPSNAMPRLSITEASPRASPAPPSSRDAPGPSQLRSVAAGVDVGEGSNASRSAVAGADGSHPPPQHQHQQAPPHSPSQSLQPQVSSGSSLGLHHAPHLPGNTPPTRAVAEAEVGGVGAGEHVPSLPSSTFGPPLASPLFGGLFAPLSMGMGAGSHEVEELELERDGETALQI